MTSACPLSVSIKVRWFVSLDSYREWFVVDRPVPVLFKPDPCKPHPADLPPTKLVWPMICAAMCQIQFFAGASHPATPATNPAYEVSDQGQLQATVPRNTRGRFRETASWINVVHLKRRNLEYLQHPQRPPGAGFIAAPRIALL